MLEEKALKSEKKRFYRKRVRLFTVINKIKLWPSRSGKLHGVRSIDVSGDVAKITIHCSRSFHQKNSLNSRAGRWLRNKWYVKECPACGVPEWKIEKYSSTRFSRHQGALLIESTPVMKIGSAAL